MQRRLSIAVIVGALVAMSAGCVHRGNHTIRRMWADYNTLGAPAFYLEQEDHLPYHQARVGHFRWAYNKDPGRQLASLGSVRPQNCNSDESKCDGDPDKPYEYEVLYPWAMPGQTEHLWGTKLPEPINVRRDPEFAPFPNIPGSDGAKVRSPGTDLVPILPPMPPPVVEPATPQLPPPAPPAERDRPGDKLNAQPKSSRAFPILKPPPPNLKPVDEDVSPLLGPTSDPDRVRLTTDPGRPSKVAEPPQVRWPR